MRLHLYNGTDPNEGTIVRTIVYFTYDSSEIEVGSVFAVRRRMKVLFISLIFTASALGFTPLVSRSLRIRDNVLDTRDSRSGRSRTADPASLRLFGRPKRRTLNMATMAPVSPALQLTSDMVRGIRLN